MLSKKDKEWIREAIKSSIIEALTMKVDYEKVRDEKTGQPLAKPERITRDVFLPVWLVEYLPYTEGALRGMQSTIDKADGERLAQLSNVVNVIMAAENSLKTIASISDRVKLENNKPKLLEGTYEDTDT